MAARKKDDNFLETALAKIDNLTKTAPRTPEKKVAVPRSSANLSGDCNQGTSNSSETNIVPGNFGIDSNARNVSNSAGVGTNLERTARTVPGIIKVPVTANDVPNKTIGNVTSQRNLNTATGATVDGATTSASFTKSSGDYNPRLHPSFQIFKNISHQNGATSNTNRSSRSATSPAHQNTYANAVQAHQNTYANAVQAHQNTYANAVQAHHSTYANAVQARQNTYANAVQARQNTYANAAQVHQKTYANAAQAHRFTGAPIEAHPGTSYYTTPGIAETNFRAMNIPYPPPGNMGGHYNVANANIQAAGLYPRPSYVPNSNDFHNPVANSEIILSYYGAPSYRPYGHATPTSNVFEGYPGPSGSGIGTAAAIPTSAHSMNMGNSGGQHVPTVSFGSSINFDTSDKTNRGISEPHASMANQFRNPSRTVVEAVPGDRNLYGPSNYSAVANIWAPTGNINSENAKTSRYAAKGYGTSSGSNTPTSDVSMSFESQKQSEDLASNNNASSGRNFSGQSLLTEQIEAFAQLKSIMLSGEAESEFAFLSRGLVHELEPITRETGALLTKSKFLEMSNVTEIKDQLKYFMELVQNCESSESFNQTTSFKELVSLGEKIRAAQAAQCDLLPILDAACSEEKIFELNYRLDRFLKKISLFDSSIMEALAPEVYLRWKELMAQIEVLSAQIRGTKMSFKSLQEATDGVKKQLETHTKELYSIIKFAGYVFMPFEIFMGLSRPPLESQGF